MSASKTPIYTALAANLVIAATKLTAAFITGSSAMASEGVHSLVDCSNEVLLFLGIRNSQKPPDARRPFGYGKELYFWSFVVSILFFAIGGAVSIYEGVQHMLYPEVIENQIWNYVVLGVAFTFDGISLITALREFNRQRGSTPFWKAVRQSKDPATFVVLFEDAADVIGVLIAAAGITASLLFHNPHLDGLASVLIGILLTLVALFLMRESRSLLMGESAPADELEAIKNMLKADPGVAEVTNQLSMYMSPEEVILLTKLRFKPDVSSQDMVHIIKTLRQNVQSRYPQYQHFIIEPV